jgi:hypothetical protein
LTIQNGLEAQTVTKLNAANFFAANFFAANFLPPKLK